ncbi:hypothetical protein [Vibrio nitrifigilis]|uniref:Lipoprotein n=1 Tax=Vibrio nitrifigilis TaxID=2789781 RepID=A0ABS0GMK0_9VIBR|nr:hypothetical protein [Vibrio nitrifigilis]MBF9003567.1 hypothetical protein [Vibrio nitrifigilis]
MKFSKITISLILAAFLSGCASGLNSMQQREYAAMEKDGVLIKEKNPNTGMALGLLPGGGSFYAREPGLGVVNLLFWPLSVLWDPFSGKQGAESINYDVTKHYLKQEIKKEMSELDDKLALGKISNEQYIVEKRKIENKYSYE